MTESMDIAFLLVGISPTNLWISTVTCIISSIINPLIENNYDIRLALIKLRSGDHSPVPIIHSLTRSAVKFKHWLVTDHVHVRQQAQGETAAICKTNIVSLLSCFF
jgi:hypothetical protein